MLQQKQRPLLLLFFFFFASILSSKSSLARNSSCCLFSICPYVPHELSLISVLSLYLAAVIGKDEQRHEGRQHTHTNKLPRCFGFLHFPKKQDPYCFDHVITAQSCSPEHNCLLSPDSWPQRQEFQPPQATQICSSHK